MGKIIKGLIITPTENKTLNIYNPGYIVITDRGVIEYVGKEDVRKKYSSYEFEDYGKQLIIPGLVDTHNHLPQYSFAGIGGGQLLPWLENYAFPCEQKFSSDEIASLTSKLFFKDLIKNGTTTTLSFVTIHKNATDIAFMEAEKIGIRAVIGKVMMDQNSPDALQENIDSSIKESEELIQKWHKKNGRLFYALTPRFAITCSFELLKRAGRLMNEYGVYLQTHLSENLAELDFVRKIFPTFKNYLDVYDQAGILGDKTLMSHCIYLSDIELDVLKKTETNIIHCPTSNRFMSSGIMNYRKYSKIGLKISLGSDVAGGYSLSMFNEMKEAIENSKMRVLFFDKEVNSMTIEEAFYLATLGGATALSLQDSIGSLDVGKNADIVVIDPEVVDPMRDSSIYTKSLEQLSKCIYRNSSSMVKSVYIQGEKLV
mgnify:CR=1 FL=1